MFTGMCLSTGGGSLVPVGCLVWVCLLWGGAVPGPDGCLVPGGVWSWGVSGPGGCLVLGGLVPGGVWSWGVPGPGGSRPRGMTGPGGSGPGGVPGGDPHPDGNCCGRYASYWNAFLFRIRYSRTVRKTTLNSAIVQLKIHVQC